MVKNYRTYGVLTTNQCRRSLPYGRATPARPAIYRKSDRLVKILSDIATLEASENLLKDPRESEIFWDDRRICRIFLDIPGGF